LLDASLRVEHFFGNTVTTPERQHEQFISAGRAVTRMTLLSSPSLADWSTTASAKRPGLKEPTSAAKPGESERTVFERTQFSSFLNGN